MAKTKKIVAKKKAKKAIPKKAIETTKNIWLNRTKNLTKVVLFVYIEDIEDFKDNLRRRSPKELIRKPSDKHFPVGVEYSLMEIAGIFLSIEEAVDYAKHYFIDEWGIEDEEDVVDLNTTSSHFFIELDLENKLATCVYNIDGELLG